MIRGLKFRNAQVRNQEVAPALRAAHLLGLILVPLVVVASAGGLLLDGLYRDNLWASSQFRGSDLIRLFICVPVSGVALLLSWRGSLRGRLIWLGTLALTLYDYAFYLFGAAFNEFFLLYVALVSLPLFAVALALPAVDANEVQRSFRRSVPVRPISAYLMTVAIFLGGLWSAESLRFVLSGRLPASLVDSGIHTAIVFALDLSLLVPAAALAAVWLWHRRPLGYVLAALMLVKGALYPLALIGMSVFHARATGGRDPMVFFWILFAVLGLLAALSFFSNMRGGDVALL